MIIVELNEVPPTHKHLEELVFFFVGYHECGSVEVEVLRHKKFTVYGDLDCNCSTIRTVEIVKKYFKMKFEENELVGTHYFFNPDMVTLL